MFALPAVEMTDMPNKCVKPACDLCAMPLLLLPTERVNDEVKQKQTTGVICCSRSVMRSSEILLKERHTKGGRCYLAG